MGQSRHIYTTLASTHDDTSPYLATYKGLWRTESTKTSDTLSDSDEDDIEQPCTFADVFAEAEALMTRLHGKDLTKVKVLTVENAVKVVSKALDVLAATWPVLGGQHPWSAVS